jgi:hypothetical protein
MIGLWIFAWYAWLTPAADISDRPLGSLTLKEVTDHIFWFLFWFGGLFLMGRHFINYDEDFIDWEGWGRFGLWIVGIATAGALWLAYH